MFEQHFVLRGPNLGFDDLEYQKAAKLVLIDAEPIDIARQMRQRAEQTIRPAKAKPER